MTPELRSEWTCAECGTRRFFCDREPRPAPPGWDRATDRCLACVKQNETQESAEVRARRLVLDGKKTNEIARSCQGVTKDWINDLRDELIESGDLTSVKAKKSPPQPKALDPKQSAAERALRDEPTMSNGEVAVLVGAARKTVGVWRRKLDLPTSESARRAEATALIAADPTLQNAEVKARMRHPVSAPLIRQIRSELGIAPPALN